MPSTTITAPARADLGDTITIWVVATDDDGVAAVPTTITAAATLPDGTAGAPVVTAQAAVGLYSVTLTTTQTGRHTIALTVTDTDWDESTAVTTWAVQVDALAGAPPDVSAVAEYLGDLSASSAEIADAYAAEVAAQAARCRIPADYPDDLGQALKRRVARNLAARRVPVAQFTSFEGLGTVVRVPQLDAEITRLEAPHRRLTVG